MRPDHRTAGPDGRRRNEHRGPGVSQTLRPHGGQRGDRGRGDGRQGPRLADARDRLDEDFIINARTDVFAVAGLDEAVERCNRYLAAGADLAFIDGIKARADIEKAVARVKGPLSVNLMDAVSGMKTELVPIPELARMGVGRVSIPVASCMVAQKALMDFFTALKAAPAGILPGETQWISSFEQFTDFVGLKDYRKLEDEYLPQERMADKYRAATKIVG